MFEVKAEYESQLNLVTFFVYYKGQLMDYTTDASELGRIIHELSSDLLFY